MNYPGDPQLSPDVQNRILATFEQTLALAEQGNRQEALLGCDFVLRMDPQFAPARRLVERLEDGNGAPAVADLRAGLAAAAPERDLFDLSTLGDELPELADEIPLDGASDGDLRTRLEGLFAARRFEELLAEAEREVGAVIADPRLGALAEAARERMEAAPYVARFVGKARQTLEAGDAAEAARLLEKARSLDETHPEVVALERSIMTSTRAPAAPAAPALAEPELPAALRPTVPDDLLGGGPGDAESERRIAQLLAEGQAALDGGDPQAAIDSWSRIFLIDIDHQEAARRIELARKLKAENERQVEEVFHDGVASLEAGDLAAARSAFARVLELQPGYLAAREYVEQIDAGTVPSVRPRPAGSAPAAAPAATARPAPGAGEPALPAGELPDLTDVELKEEILVPPEPGEVPARAAERRTGAVAAAAREGRFDRKFLYIGGAVLALVLAAAAYVLLNWDTFFPNSDSDELAAPAPAPDPIEQALALHRGGDTPAALAKLRQVPPVHPKHARAEALIAEWTRPAAPAVLAGLPALAPEVAARRQAALAAARQAYSGNANLLAVRRFEEAAALARLDPADADQLSRAKSRLEPLAQQIALFKDREWEYVVPALWRLREEAPGSPDIDRLLVDSYYNLGVRDLQQFNPEEAVKHFEEALKLDPRDEAVRRQYMFADTYRERPQDLLFRIYVKYLSFR